MRYEKLSLTGFVDEVKEVSQGSHTRKFCFVLGAGASISSGIKSGQELVTIWDKELFERNGEEHLKWKQDQGITEENKYHFYSKFYEKRFRRNSNDGYNYLEKQMEHASPGVGYVMLSYLLANTKHNVVITTNFDHLIEDAVNYYAQTIPMVIGHESLTGYITKQIARPTIIKIHRDLLFDPKNRTDELEELHDDWKKTLREVFSDYHPVFIGYAGNDNSLMNFLLENSEKFLGGEWKYPYWMIYYKEAVGGKVLEFLESSEGYLIQHGGFDEVMCLLGTKLDYKIPVKEVFQAEVEKRFQNLYNSIDKLTEIVTNESKIQTDSEEQKEENVKIVQAVENVTSQTEQQRLYREACILYSSDKYEAAWQIAAELVRVNSDNPRYHFLLGHTLYKMGKVKEAEAELRSAVEREPWNAEYHSALGIALYKMEHYEEAVKEIREAVRQEPWKADYDYKLGIVLNEIKNYEEAEKALKNALSLEPDNAKYHSFLGWVLCKAGKHEEAKKRAYKAAALEPHNAKYHNVLGVVLLEMGNHEEAEAEVRRALALEPDNAQSHNDLGMILQKKGNYKEGEKELRKAVELLPDKADYHNNLGDCLYDLGNYMEAEEEVRRAVELKPDVAVFRNSLGFILQAMEKFEESVKELRIAIQLKLDDAACYYNLAYSLFAMRNYEEAEKAIQKAIELEPGNAENHMMRAFIIGKMGKNQEMEKELQMAVKMDSSIGNRIRSALTKET